MSDISLKELAEALGFNPGYPWTREGLLEEANKYVRKYSGHQMQARYRDGLQQGMKACEALKAELKRIEGNYGRLSAKYARLKEALRELRKQEAARVIRETGGDR